MSFRQNASRFAESAPPRLALTTHNPELYADKVNSRSAGRPYEFAMFVAGSSWPFALGSAIGSCTSWFGERASRATPSWTQASPGRARHSLLVRYPAWNACCPFDGRDVVVP